MNLLSLILVVLLALSTPSQAWTWGSEADLDFSSQDALKKSVEKVTADMSPSEREDFGKALLHIFFEKNPITGPLEEGFPRLIAAGELGDAFFDDMDVWMSDVTVDDVVAKAKENSTTKAEPEPHEDTSVLQKGQECLNAQIVLSNFRFESDMMSFDITNNLSFAISAVHFEYMIRQTDRSVAIHKESDTFSISGGVEPQETRNLSYYHFGPTGEEGKVFVETRILNAFDADEMPLLDTNTIYVGKPDASQEGFSSKKCQM